MEPRLVGGKLLRRGYTTGSCAAAAAKAAAVMLLTQAALREVTLTTQKGGTLTLDVLDARITDGYASCAVRKDSGDDPDVTNGCLVYARVSPAGEGIKIGGGAGIGKVTKPGLDQPVGAFAINTVPRRMIHEACTAVCLECGYTGGLSVVLSVPGGEELARRTFNPRMGIEGGLSILGTTGIVEPMSEAALEETIRAELSLMFELGHRDLLLTIGNYGEAFARDVLRLPMEAHVKCSNLIGETLSAAVEKGFSRVMLTGHIGKLIKLGIGITNTHSSHGDGRKETFIACALEAGASLNLLRKIEGCVSTESMLDCLREEGLTDGVMAVLKNRIEDTLVRHVAGNLKINVICFGGTGEKMEELFSI